MRLERVVIEDYRVHRRLELEFAPGLSVISAPNESGKSTLVEAVHRALFLHHRTGGQVQKGMLSRGGGHPRVELRFAAEGRHWTLEKHFRGASGVCSLVAAEGAERFEGDAAEERLGALTGRQPARGRGKELDESWAHLWLWQGSAGGDPLARAGAQELFAALAGRAEGGEGGETVLTADDRALIETVRAEVDAVWDARRSGLRAGSEARAREQEAEDLEQRVAQLRAERETRAQQAEQLATCRRLAADAASNHATQAPRVEASVRELAELERIHAGLAPAREALTQAERAHDELHRAQIAAGERARTLEAATTREAEQRRELARLQLERGESVRRLEELARQQEAARHARQTADDQAERHEAEAARARLREREDQLTAARERHAARVRELAAAREALATAPAVEPEAVEHLRELEAVARNARTQVEAVAAVVTWNHGGEAVAIDGEALERGRPRSIDREVELRCGDGSVIGILPGGGEDLGARRERLERARRELDAALEACGARSLAEATAFAERRREAQAAVTAAEARLEHGHDPAAELAEVRREAERLEQRIAALAERGVGFDPAADATALRECAEAERRRAQELSQALDHARAREAEQRAAAEDARDAAERAGHELAACRARVAADAEQLGDAEARAAALDARRAARQDAAAAVNAIEARLAEVDLATRRTAVELERARLEQLRETETANRAQARVLADQLQAGRERDLEAEIEELEARLERARAAAAAARERAEAGLLLLTELEALRDELQARREAPFLDACCRYLGLAFGRPSAIRLAGEGEARRIAEVCRDEAQLGSFDFQVLSHGARELVGVAINLAMAEVIAASHDDGSLPIVLDDAFTNVDPQRFQQVGLMLATAARRGVQVVMCTCDQAKAQLLVADRHLQLPPPQRNGARPADAPATAGIAGDAAAGPARDAGRGEPDPDDGPANDHDRFLDRLRQLDGEASARSLRQALDWDAPRFQAARTALEADGHIETPAGTRSIRIV